jgi:hypothetical protein
VSFASSTPTVCRVIGNLVTLESTGTCTIVASQPGNDDFNPALDVPRSFGVNEAPLTPALFLPSVEG